MPFEGNYSIKEHLNTCKRKELKRQYWLNKGCSVWKAEELLERYGY